MKNKPGWYSGDMGVVGYNLARFGNDVSVLFDDELVGRKVEKY